MEYEKKARSELRKQAETKLAAEATGSSKLSSQDSQTLIHELRTHQIELEMQNEELRRSEHALTTARDKYSDLYDFAPVGYVTINEKGLTLQANLTLADLLEIERDLLINQPFSTFIAAEDQDIFYHHRRAVLTSSTQQCCEIQLKKESGETFWARFESTVAKYAGETDQQLLMTVSDISSRKQAEKMMEAYEKKLLMLSSSVEQTSDAIIITDSEGTIQYINPAFSILTGYSEQETIGQNPRFLKSGVQSDAFYQEMWEQLGGGRAWYGRTVDKKKDGSFYPAMLTISPVKNESGEIVNYVGIQQDLSKHENLEAQFHQAQKMEAIGTLVGGIAHDFNNMLAGITGNLYLAKTKSKDQPEVIDRLNSVEQLSFRAASMIQQLLTFARKGRVDMKLLPLIPFIKETLKFLRTSVPENIDIRQNICSDSIQIKGDSTQLHQVLMNLINNARDALEGIENPHINVNIELFNADALFVEKHPYFEAEAYARISIEDNGCGIPAYQLKHLFEPFFTTKEPGKGTGLGLAMVFGAIKTHHGFVEVESAPDTGSTFHVYIPIVEDKEFIYLPHQHEVREGNGETILFVDDDKNVRDTNIEILKSLNYKVFEASDGLQAVDMFITHQNEINLIIMDLVMPKFGGVEAFNRIREVQADIKVIFSTGYDKTERLNNQIPLGNFVILSKPHSIEQLSTIIREQLSS